MGDPGTPYPTSSSIRTAAVFDSSIPSSSSPPSISSSSFSLIPSSFSFSSPSPAVESMETRFFPNDSSSSSSFGKIDLPCGVEESPLSLEPRTPWNRVDRMVGRNRYSPSRSICGDRFIPCRSASRFDLFNVSPSSSEGRDGGGDSPYSTLLRRALFGTDDAASTPEKLSTSQGRSVLLNPPNMNIFRFKTETKRPASSLFLLGSDESSPDGDCIAVKRPRIVSTSPYKVLDAPELLDDFYLNLVDWSSENMLAVGLGRSVYLWNASNGKVSELCELGDNDSVCSVGWAQKGSSLALGTNNGEVQIWDVSRSKLVRTMAGHRLRVGAVSWSSSLLSSGSRDKTIFLRDTRSHEDFTSKLTGHRSEVCGLKWSPENHELASGGNDNKLLIWNKHSTRPVLKYCEHTAAVKAIAWSPHSSGIIASGGGTADRCIRFRNTITDSLLSCVDTGSQVCNLAWSKNVNEVVSTHGYSENQIVVWKYPTMSKLATLTGHTRRILHLAVSPDGQTIVTGAADETLRFWSVFPSPKSEKGAAEEGGAFSFGRSQIR